MRLQSTLASCGPAALHNALLVRGIARSEEELSKLCGYKPAVGTSPRGMMRALLLIAKDHSNLLPGVLSERREDIALLRLLAAHRSGMVAILLVDQDEHWVVSFGTLGEQIIHVADSGDDEMVTHYTPQELLERWRGTGKNAYYAIII